MSTAVAAIAMSTQPKPIGDGKMASQDVREPASSQMKRRRILSAPPIVRVTLPAARNNDDPLARLHGELRNVDPSPERVPAMRRIDCHADPVPFNLRDLARQAVIGLLVGRNVQNKAVAKDSSATPLDAAQSQEARHFMDRLTQRGLPRNHIVPDGVEVTAPVRSRKTHIEIKDPVASATRDPDSKAVRNDIAVAMTMIQRTLATIKTLRANDLKDPDYDPEDEVDEQGTVRQIADRLQRTGRGKFTYAALTRKGKMDEMLAAWDRSWRVEKTVGLLIDMSLVLRKARARDGDVQDGSNGKVLSRTLKASRREHGTLNTRSDWYQNLPENARTHTGASSTTAILLLMLEDLDVPLAQVEAVMNGVVQYWSAPTRRASGLYHTATEVWSVYNEHLESRLSLQWAMNKQRIDEAAQSRRSGSGPL